MLSGTAAPEILPSADQDLCLIIRRSIQHKVSVLACTWVLSECVEECIGKACALKRLEELFGDDHVGVDVVNM